MTEELLGIRKAIGDSFSKLTEVLGRFLGPSIAKREMKALAEGRPDLNAAGLEIVEAELRGIPAKVLPMSTYQQQRQAANIGAVSAVAARALPESVSEEELDEDWIVRFFNHVQDISNARVQQIWGCLLAGELKQPGSFSLRTLDTLRNMNAAEAETWSRITPYALSVLSEEADDALERGFLPEGQVQIGKRDRRALRSDRHYGPVALHDFRIAVESGLIHRQEPELHTVPLRSGREVRVRNGNEPDLVFLPTGGKALIIRCRLLTSAGAELLPVTFQPAVGYHDLVKETLEGVGLELQPGNRSMEDG